MELKAKAEANRFNKSVEEEGMLVIVLVSLIVISHIDGCHVEASAADATMIFSAGSDSEKHLDPNTTIIELRNLISTIDRTQNFYPGLVSFTKWQDALGNQTVMARVLVWTPSCSMEAFDGEYNASGDFIKTTMLDMLTGACASTTAKGVYWATCIRENMWLDYFSVNRNSSGVYTSHNIVTSHRRLGPEDVRTNSNESLTPTELGIFCYPNLVQGVDSLISDSNELWNTLYSGDYMMSSDKRYLVEMQEDCNLVAYTYPAREPGWASDTQLAGTNCSAIMQNDGNLVVYSGNWTVLWSSRSNVQDYAGSFRFTIQTDGRSVVYNMESGQILWSGLRTYRPPT